MLKSEFKEGIPSGTHIQINLVNTLKIYMYYCYIDKFMKMPL